MEDNLDYYDEEVDKQMKELGLDINEEYKKILKDVFEREWRRIKNAEKEP